MDRKSRYAGNDANRTKENESSSRSTGTNEPLKRSRTIESNASSLKALEQSVEKRNADSESDEREGLLKPNNRRRRGRREMKTKTTGVG